MYRQLRLSFGGRFGGPLDPSNFRKRVLHKLAEELELPKLTFQVIRRTIATLAQKLGSSKDVQGFMRHETTDTTENVYMQVLLPGVRTTLDAIHAELSKKAEASPAPEPPMTPARKRRRISSSRNDVLGMPTAIPENTHRAGRGSALRSQFVEWFWNLPPKLRHKSREGRWR